MKKRLLKIKKETILSLSTLDQVGGASYYYVGGSNYCSNNIGGGQQGYTSDTTNPVSAAYWKPY